MNLNHTPNGTPYTASPIPGFGEPVAVTAYRTAPFGSRRTHRASGDGHVLLDAVAGWTAIIDGDEITGFATKREAIEYVADARY